MVLRKMILREMVLREMVLREMILRRVILREMILRRVILRETRGLVLRKQCVQVRRNALKKQLIIGAAAAVLIAGLAGGYGVLRNKGAVGADNEPEIVLCYGEVNPEGHVLTD